MKFIISTICLLLFLSTMGLSQTQVSKPQVSLPINENSEVIFQKTVTDPFRVLEREDSLVASWYQAQADYTNEVLKQIPQRDSLAAYIHQLQTSADIRSSLPQEANGFLFVSLSYVEGDYETLIRKHIKSGKTEVLFNTQSLYNQDSIKYQIDFFQPSPSGNMVVFGLASPDTEIVSARILSVKDQKLLPDTIKEVATGQMQWLADENAIIYTQRGTSTNREDYYKGRRVRIHRLGTNQQEDKTIFSRQLYPELKLTQEDLPRAFIFPGTSTLFISTRSGTLPYFALYAVPLQDTVDDKVAWQTLFSSDDQIKRFSVYENTLVYLTTKDQANGEIVATNWNDPTSDKRILLQGADMVIRDITQTSNGFYVKYLKNGLSHFVRLDKETLAKSDVPTPFSGSADITASSFSGDPLRLTSGLYYGLMSWNKGYGIYHYDPTTNESTRTDLRPAGKFDSPSGIKVEEVEVPSHDGTMVPLSIVYSDTLTLNGNNPTMLDAYGVYGYAMEPYFDVALLAWFKQGGIYAVAHVRGGGEKGDAWYRGGLKKTKPNSWKDFIACGEYLVEKQYTSSEKLGVYTASAGGITIGRAITERSDLFQASVISVGVMNPLRFEYTMNTANVPEFGTVKDSAEFTYLLEMDPYMNIVEGTSYPAVLLTAAMNDERVEPWQPGKFVARMQQANQKNLALLRIDYEGGHFSSDYSSYAIEVADYYAFLLWQLGHPDFQPEEEIKAAKGSE